MKNHNKGDRVSGGTFQSYPELTISLIFAFLLLICLPAAQAATYYIAANGLDSNNGTSKSTPWAHLPGMPNCTGNCASASPRAGDNYIFKGGDTWSPSSLGVDWQWSGNSGARIYVGVDQTWFSGTSRRQ